MIAPWNLSLVTPASDPVVDIDRLKAHVGVSDYDEADEQLIDLEKAAVDFVEGPTGVGVALATQTWRLSLDGLPSSFSIPLGPVQSVTSITYLDADGVSQTVDPDTYIVDTDRYRALVAFIKPRPNVLAVPGSVKVTFVAGHPVVPAKLKQAVLLLVGSWFKTRENDTDAPLTEVPIGVTRILNQVRRH